MRALNSLQNCMMFRPCWPSAGPTGGDGFALPAGHCSLMSAVTFFMTLEPADRGAYAFSTWAKSSSTGVARPKIDTRTLTFCLSGFTSSTVAEKFANGPSMTRTVSPASNTTLGLRLAPCPRSSWTGRP